MGYGISHGFFREGLWTTEFSTFALVLAFAFAVFLAVLFRNWTLGMPIVIRTYAVPVAHRSRRVARKARHRAEIPAWRAMLPR